MKNLEDFTYIDSLNLLVQIIQIAEGIVVIRYNKDGSLDGTQIILL